MKRILCFGDSLTFGKIPAVDFSGGRYDENSRWTGILQKKLGNGYVVIEEGLPSRTIDLDDPTPGKEGRNGSAYLKPCLESQVPLDVVILFLGTNDTKDFYNRTAEQIAQSMIAMLQDMSEILTKHGSNPQIILVAPPKIAINKCSDYFSKASPKLQKLALLYKEITDKRSLDFIDLYETLDIPDTADGVHLSPEANKQIADLVHIAVSS